MCEAVCPSYAFLDNPGERRLRLWGRSLGDLVTESVRALHSLLGERARHGPLGPWVEVDIHGDGPQEILGAWLNRLLELAGRNQWAPVECEVTAVDDGGLRARVRGVRLEARPSLTTATVLSGSLLVPGVPGLHAEVTIRAGPARSRGRAEKCKAARSPSSR